MKLYRRLHRAMGISGVAFLMLFVMTGLLLQHAPRYNLDTSYVPAPISKWLYGVTVDTSKSYPLDDHWVSHAGHFLYLNGVPVPSIEINNLQGAVEGESDIWIIGDNKLWIISKQGEVMDELSALGGLPGMVTGIGQDTKGNIVISGLHNNWRTEGDADRWDVHAGQPVTWSMPGDPSRMTPARREIILAHARSHLISVERLLLDLHSGRLFGAPGVVIADVAALLLLFISITGAFLWLQR